jgi:hypothetical protein
MLLTFSIRDKARSLDDSPPENEYRPSARKVVLSKSTISNHPPQIFQKSGEVSLAELIQALHVGSDDR